MGRLIPFGPWEPDRSPRLNDGYLTVADGAYPMADGYRPCGQWAQIIPTLGTSPKGGASFTSPAGISTIIAGSAAGLYRGLSGGFSLLKSGYSIQGEGRWRFAQFGGLAIATNGSDPMQKIDLSTFQVSNLGGDPPRAEMLAVVKDFLVAGVVNGQINAVKWSGINNAEKWTAGTDQSDYQVFPDGGRVNGLVSGDTGLVLQRNAIRRMDYIGGNIVYAIDNTHPGVGCVSVHTLAQWGRMAWFWGDIGIMEWTGADVRLVSDEKLTRWLQSRYNKDTWPQISTAVDPVQGVILWSLPETATEPARFLGYHWRLERFFTLPYASPIIFGGVTRDVTIDEQDPAVGADDDNLDSPGLLSFDDSSFKGGDPRLYVFSSGNALGAFTGTPMAGTFTGTDVELFSGRRADIRWVRPETDAVDGITLSLSYRQRLGDAVTTDSYTSITASGDMPVRTSGRYVKPSLAYAAGTSWSYVKGLDYTAKQGAGR